MKIAHIAIVTPGRCGLYETLNELVRAERAEGVDARIVDPKPHPTAGIDGDFDRGVPLAPMEWATGADLIASHSGHDSTPVAETDQPILHVAHGRPFSTFLLERDGGLPAFSYHVQRSEQDRYRGCVTFWPEHEPYLRSLWRGKPVRVVTPPVDSERWKPGRSAYDFGGKEGGYNVVMTDPWSRRDVSSFHPIHAFLLFRNLMTGAKLHIYAAERDTKGYAALFKVLGDSLGVVQGWAKDLLPVYQSADMLITSNKIWTRSLRESMSCGVQVVSGRDVDPEDIEGFALEMARVAESPRPTRDLAKALFNPRRAAKEFIAAAESALRVPA